MRRSSRHRAQAGQRRMSDVPMRVLIVRLGALGDIVHALPVLAALRRGLPDTSVDWLVDVRHRAILEHVSGLDDVVVVDTSRGIGRLPAVVRELRRRRYDVALDLQGLIKSAVLARLSGARRVIGFGRGGLREPAAAAFYTERRGAEGGQHVIRKNLTLADALGVSTSGIEFPLVVRPPLESAQPYVLLNPGAGWPNKRWRTERFAEVARWIKERYGWRSVVLWGPHEEDRAQAIARASGDAADVAPRTTLGELLTLARGARLLVSGDTGPLHLAAAVGTPIVGIYGPTNPARNGPFRAEDVTVSRFSQCVCHHERRCRRGSACIDGISVAEVTHAIEQRLRGQL